MRILIAEDDKRLSRLLEIYLKDFGYEVVGISATGDEAVANAEITTPDLVLMDILLEGAIDGVEAAKQIRSKSDTPVIYLTGVSDDDIIEKIKTTEPYGYILKPPDPRHLKIAIEVGLYKANIEKQLKESKMWFNSALNSISEGIIVIDDKDVIKYTNRVAKFYLNQKPEDEISGKLFDDIVSGLKDPLNLSLCNLYNEVKKCTSYCKEEGLLEINNAYVKCSKVLIEASPILSDKESLIGTVIMIRCLN